ncbi:MAG: PP0621 family protein [Castellaniella sp.]|uniref:PP0621 family protein n=1 Tax=Castellaniella sp. TaxID=1955812 RepID=UPI002A367A0A|nr:PP0621 family protein [Castellaniella sp.]MDY0308989.1 PP0621 family protein [Castellaniella sp.]
MGKFLLWAIIILAVLFVSRVLSHQKAQARQSAARRQAEDARAASETMVRCAHCRIYLPRSEAYLSQGKTWCCAEHARLGLRK